MGKKVFGFGLKGALLSADIKHISATVGCDDGNASGVICYSVNPRYKGRASLSMNVNVSFTYNTMREPSP